VQSEDTSQDTAISQVIKIDKDVPLFSPRSRGGKTAKYPFRSMVVGDSFFVGNVNTRVFGPYVHTVGVRMGASFTARVTTEDGVKGMRVWRIK